MEHIEKKIDSKTLFKGWVFSVSRDSVLLENGVQTTRDVVHHRGAACVLPLTDERELYMVRQFRYAVGKELLELPAGSLEVGEEPLKTAKRELEEECGLIADEYISLHAHYPTVGYCDEIIYTWVAKGLHPVPMHLDEEEFLTPIKIPFEKALQMIRSGEIQDGKTVQGLLKAKLLMDDGTI